MSLGATGLDVKTAVRQEVHHSGTGFGPGVTNARVAFTDVRLHMMAAGHCADVEKSRQD